MPAIESSPSPADRPRLPRISFGPFTFDTHTRLLSRGTQEVALPPRVLGVLELLLGRAGDVVSRQELIDTVWKDAFVTDTSLAEAVSVLRQALGDDPQAPTYVQTLHRRGYRFVAAISPNGSSARQGIGTKADDEGIVSPSIGGQLVPWSAAVICALIAGVAVWQLTRGHETATQPAVAFAIAAAPGTVFDSEAPALAFSADGRQLAWSACDATGCRLYSRSVDRLEAIVIPGTDDAHAPFFSPDGRWVAFFADGRLKKVALAGGSPVTLADAPSVLGGTWRGGEIVFAGSPSGGLLHVPEDGGAVRTLTTPREREGEVRHVWPSAVPGTPLVLFTIDSLPTSEAPGIVAALSFDPRASGDVTRWQTLASAAHIGVAAARDILVFGHGSELDAMGFDPTRLAISGTPRSVMTAVATARGRASFAIAGNGSLAYASAQSAPDRGLSWLSATGPQGLPDEIQGLRDATLAPDGSRIAGVKIEGARADVWVTDVRRGTATRLTHAGSNSSPVWSSDGRTIYFAARTDGAFEVWRRDADGAQPAARIFADTEGGRHAIPLATSPDGKWLAFARTAAAERSNLWLLPLAGGAAQPAVNGPFDESAVAFSPDSRTIAFQSAETGRWEIYLQRLDDGRRLVVSTDGGESPLWTHDGLYFQARGHVMRASIAASENLRVETVQRVADVQGGTLRSVGADGRLLVQKDSQPANGTAIVILEWLRGVRVLLGPPTTTLPR